MATKKKKKRTKRSDAYKAKIVARVLKGRADGSATLFSIAKAEGLNATMVSSWVRKAGAVSIVRKKKVTARKSKPAGDIASITSQLSAAMAKVSELKNQLRELLAD